VANWEPLWRAEEEKCTARGQWISSLTFFHFLSWKGCGKTELLTRIGCEMIMASENSGRSSVDSLGGEAERKDL
jgi:hypothetical protein